MDKLKSVLKRFFKTLGPGFISGSADDDPTAIATYTQAGASFGYSQLWTAILTIPFMIVIQEMCGRIGMVTGKGLSGIIKRHFSRPVLYFVIGLLLVTNVVNISADLGAMASSAELIVNLPFWFWLLGLTAVTLLLEVFISYPTYAKYLKYLTISFFAYIAVAFLVRQDWSKIVLGTIVPSLSLSKDYLLFLMAILGTNISPYLFFWQADEEVEEEVEKGKIRAMGRGTPKVSYYDFQTLRLDTTVGMIFSNVVVFFIAITAASTLGISGITNITTASQAAQALRPLAGNLAGVLFAIGLIGSGLLAVPILAGSAAYAFAEAFGWKEGLSQKLKVAHGFYGVITIATLLGILINFSPIQPFQLLFYAAALNGILAPPLLVLLIVISNKKEIMAGHRNNTLTNAAAITITLLMTLASVFFVKSLF